MNKFQVAFKDAMVVKGVAVRTLPLKFVTGKAVVTALQHGQKAS